MLKLRANIPCSNAASACTHLFSCVIVELLVLDRGCRFNNILTSPHLQHDEHQCYMDRLVLTQLTARRPPVMLQGTIEQSLHLFEAGQLSPWELRLFL